MKGGALRACCQESYIFRFFFFFSLQELFGVLADHFDPQTTLEGLCDRQAAAKDISL